MRLAWREAAQSPAAGDGAPPPPPEDEITQLKAEINGLKEEVVELKFELKAEVHRHVAYRAAHDEDIQKLKQKVDKLTALVTAVPDDD